MVSLSNKTVAFVPIKLNSERLPFKNIKPFKNGKPLIYYILNTLRQVKNVDEIHVYCSDKKVLEYLPEGVIFTNRDEYLDLSETPFNEVLKSFAKQVYADQYVLTHATAPFIKASSIETANQKVMTDGYDSAVGVVKVQEFLWRDGKPINYELNCIPRTQDLPLIYAESCGLYIYKRNLIINKGRRIGDNPYFAELSKIEAIDINDHADFIIAEAIFNNGGISFE